MYYQGRLRQVGGASPGLGDIFHAMTRVFTKAIPAVGKMYRNRNNPEFRSAWLRKVAPKAVAKVAKFGVGIVKDVAKKKSLKQALKDGGKRMITDALNIEEPPRKRQKRPVVRTGNTPPRRKKKARPRDIFD